MSMSMDDRRALYKKIRDGFHKPLECHICHAVLAGRGGNFFCPECRLIVSHEDKQQTLARRDFFKYLDDYDEERKDKMLECQRDELTRRK